NIRWRRDFNRLHPQEVQYKVQGLPEIRNLRLRRNDNININVPTCVIEDGVTVCEYGNDKNTAFYHTVDKKGAFSITHDTKWPSSRPRLEGVLISNKQAFIVEPGSQLTHTLTSATHHVKKRSVFIPSMYSIGPSYRRRVNYIDRRMIHITDRRTVERYSDNMLGEMNFSGKENYIVEVLILIDHSLFRKFLRRHGGDEHETITKLKYYFAHTVNGVDLRYTSINNTDFSVSIRLAGFFVAKNATDLPFVMTYRQGGDRRAKVDGSTTLLGLTNFLRDKPDLPHYDHAMLFTENDATNGRGYILGTSYLSGICTPMSTSVIVDHGSYTSAGIAAHELGHNLGVIFHDGDDKLISRGCPREMNYIMAPSSAIINSQTKEYSFKFSECSVAQIQEHVLKLKKRHRNCLEEDTGPSFATIVVQPYLSIPPGQIEDVHSQCRQLYGNDSFMCPPASIEEMCYKMYCFDPSRKMCITGSEQRAAMGTSCGDKKWCKLGKCVKDDKAPSVTDDCPFPDIPPPRATCADDASPMQCQDPIFYKRCCESCNKNFTEADFCKDSKILINGLKCHQFVAKYSQEICNYDPNVRTFCCASCSKSNPYLPTSPPATPPVRSRSRSRDCYNNTFVRINGLPCDTFILQHGRGMCRRAMVKQHCCASCS
ncbi:hypothetical protein FSP39_025486, partial [Pinctada imbricata]